MCAATRVMDGSGCGITSTGGVWLCCGMVVGCRFRVCVVRGREIERCSGAGQSFSKKKNGSAGVRRSGSGRGRGSGWEGVWGFWTARCENVEMRCVWCGSVCVREEGAQRGLCLRALWRNGEAVEQWRGAVEQ